MSFNESISNFLGLLDDYGKYIFIIIVLALVGVGIWAVKDLQTRIEYAKNHKEQPYTGLQAESHDLQLPNFPLSITWPDYKTAIELPGGWLHKLYDRDKGTAFSLKPNPKIVDRLAQQKWQNHKKFLSSYTEGMKGWLIMSKDGFLTFVPDI